MHIQADQAILAIHLDRVLIRKMKRAVRSQPPTNGFLAHYFLTVPSSSPHSQSIARERGASDSSRTFHT
jgi:hypothetical protein